MIQWILNFLAAIFAPKPIQIVPLPVDVKPSDPVVLSLSQKAYAIAKKELGVEETPGDRNNKRILQYHQATELEASEDSVPWCSAFMNWCIQGGDDKDGGKGTRDAMARSWLNWGQKVAVPQEGDTVIFSSPTRGSESGHVAFFVAKSFPGFIKVLGGNQSDSVCYENYPTALVLGYRRSLDG